MKYNYLGIESCIPIGYLLTQIQHTSTKPHGNINASCTFAWRNFAPSKTNRFPGLFLECLGVFGIKMLLVFEATIGHLFDATFGIASVLGFLNSFKVLIMSFCLFDMHQSYALDNPV